MPQLCAQFVGRQYKGLQAFLENSGFFLHVCVCQCVCACLCMFECLYVLVQLIITPTDNQTCLKYGV